LLPWIGGLMESGPAYHSPAAWWFPTSFHWQSV